MDNISLTIARELLSTALSSVAKALPKRQINPVLGNILFDGQGDTLRLVATDGDFRLTRKIVLTSPISGQWLIPGAEITDFAAKTKGNDISLTSEGNVLSVVSGGSKAKLALSLGDFPPDGDEPESWIEVEAKELSGALAAAAPMPLPPRDGTPKWENALALRIDGNDLIVSGAEGMGALSYSHVSLPEPAPRIDLMLPHDMGQALSDLVPQDDEILLGTAAGCLHVNAGSLLARLPLLTIERPDFERLFVSDRQRRISCDTGDFRDALSTLSLANRWDQRTTMHLIYIEGRLGLSVDMQAKGAVETSIAAESTFGPFTFLTNSAVLGKLLSTIKGGNLTIESPENAKHLVLIRHSRTPGWTGLISNISTK